MFGRGHGACNALDSCLGSEGLEGRIRSMIPMRVAIEGGRWVVTVRGLEYIVSGSRADVQNAINRLAAQEIRTRQESSR